YDILKKELAMPDVNPSLITTSGLQWQQHIGINAKMYQIWLERICFMNCIIVNIVKSNRLKEYILFHQSFWDNINGGPIENTYLPFEYELQNLYKGGCDNLKIDYEKTRLFLEKRPTTRRHSIPASIQHYSRHACCT
ncbi:hypothetical protein ACJX0J_026739, partial [Zea mays]